MEANSDKKRIKEQFLSLLLSSIQTDGDSIRTIAKSVNLTPQALNYHLKKLKSLKVIEKNQSYPFAIYSLTPFGIRIKENIVQSVVSKPFWRCHDLILGFEISSFGNFDWNSHKISEMRGWSFVTEEITDSIGIWKVHIQSTGLLKIYCPEIYTEDSRIAFGTMNDIASRLARKYEEMYGMKIGLMKEIREGHKELVNSEKLAKLFGKIKIGNVWVDKSTGTEWLEERQSENKIEELLRMPESIKALDQRLTPAIEKLTQQIELHLAVLQKMSDTLDKK